MKNFFLRQSRAGIHSVRGFLALLQSFLDKRLDFRRAEVLLRRSDQLTRTLLWRAIKRDLQPRRSRERLQHRIQLAATYEIKILIMNAQRTNTEQCQHRSL